MIRLNVWQCINKPENIIILYDFQIPFEDSATTQTNWKLWFSFYAIDPLQRPYPKDTELFNAQHYSRYPFELVSVIKEPFIMNKVIDKPGVYFVAYNKPVANTVRLPVKSETPVYVYK